MIPLTDKPPVNVLEDAEYYFGKDESLKAAFTVNAVGDTIEPSITTEHKSNGSYGMQLDYEFGANYYAGVTKTLAGTDLSSFDALQAWVKGDGSGNKLTFQFRLADNSVWEAVKTLNGTEGQTIQVKYDEFAQPEWDTPVEAMDMSDVREFSLYVSSDAAATANAGTVYLDNIRVASSTKLDNYESYGGYDTLVQKAYSRNTGGGQFDVSLTSEHKSEGAYGLKLDYDVAAAGYAGATLSPNYLGLNGYDGFSMWFKPDDSRNKLVIQFTTEDGKYWETSTTIKGTDARLVYVPFSKFRHPGWYGGDPNATPDVSKKIIAFSTYINKDEGVTRETSGTVYIDDINGADFEARLASSEVSIEAQDGASVTAFPYTVAGMGPANEYVAIAVGQQKFYALADSEGNWTYDIPRMVNGEERVIKAAVELYDETAVVSDTVTVNVDVPGNTYQEETPGGGEEEPPVDTTNYAVNGGFEVVAQEGVWPLLPQGWSHVDAAGEAVTDGKVKLEGNARTGNYKLVHYNGGPYEAITSQTVTGLSEGIYEVTAWTQSKTGNPQLAEMSVRSDDDDAVVEAIEPGEGTWVQQKLTNIAVTNGTLTIAFRSKNVAGDFWIGVDDVELRRIGDINYAANGSFESFTADVSTGALLADQWESVDASGEPVTDGTAKVEASASSHSGDYQLAHWNEAAYVVTTSQEVTGLKDGVYELRAWTRSKGGQTKAELTASGYGGAKLVEAIEAGESTWVQQKISGIEVTEGKLTIGIHSDSPAGMWIVVDDVELVRTGDLPDDGGGNGDGDNGNGNGGNTGGGGVIMPGASDEPKPYTKAQIQASMKDGEMALTANEAGVRIPADIASWIGENELRVQAGGAELVIPAGVLEQLAGLVSEGELADASIEIAMTKLETDAYGQLLDEAAEKRGAVIKSAGHVYEFSLRVIDAAGEAAELSELASPVMVKLLKDAKGADGFTGIYYISDNGDIEYAGRLTEDGYIVAAVQHFSKYGVLSYSKSFQDVADTHWASHAVKELAAMGIVQGVTFDEFRPGGSVTRAEFAAMLVRALGLQADGEEEPAFADVAADSWYAGAVAAAAEYGIVQGRGGNLFAPEVTITREEMAVMLVRAAELIVGEPLVAEEDAIFVDGGEISEWAKDAVNVAYALELVQGDEMGRFKPQGTATRAHSAQVIHRLVQ
nr:S-layer homology domain-containing protein [Paenibacillus soyae]